jgi:hypothetical protein
MECACDYEPSPSAIGGQSSMPVTKAKPETSSSGRVSGSIRPAQRPLANIHERGRMISASTMPPSLRSTVIDNLAQTGSGWGASQQVPGPERSVQSTDSINVIRMTAGIAAKQESILPREISFVSTCQCIHSNWDLACFSTLDPDECIRQILRCISQCRIGRRRGRFEPRCVKRRRDQSTLMMEPRDKLRQRLSKGDNSFE